MLDNRNDVSAWRTDSADAHHGLCSHLRNRADLQPAAIPSAERVN